VARDRTPVEHDGLWRTASGSDPCRRTFSRSPLPERTRLGRSRDGSRPDARQSSASGSPRALNEPTIEPVPAQADRRER
jgi:hypothetical protein